MRLLAALAASIVVFAAAALVAQTGEGGAPPGAVLAAPEPGTVRAELLPSGEPVFVVGHLDGEFSVLSAVNPHLSILAVWCPSSRGFEEPGPASRWDEYGHWLSGPAPTGLSPYEARSVDGAVYVGGRGDPPGRDVPAHAPWGPSCDWDVEETGGGWLETVRGAVGHDLDELYGEGLAPGAAARGRLSRLRARVEVAAGAVRLCAPADEPGCGREHWPVRSFFHNSHPWPYPATCSGFLDGPVLARRAGAGFQDIAVLAGYAGMGAYGPGVWERDSLTCEWGDETDEVVAGLLVALERAGAGWVAVLDDGRRGTIPGPDWPLVPDRGAEPAAEPTPGQRLPQTHYRLEQVPALVEERGPVPAELWFLPDGTVRQITLLERPPPGQ